MVSSSQLRFSFDQGDVGLAQRIARTQSPLHQARHLPVDFYTSQETYELEKERIFLQDWLCVGRVEEFEKPGDYLTLCIADEPIVEHGAVSTAWLSVPSLSARTHV